MATTRGYATRLGLRREALAGTPTWPGTAIAASGLLPFVGCTVEDTPLLETLPAERATGVFPGGVVLRQHQVGGTVTLPLAYTGLESLWCALLGMQARSLSDVAQPVTVETGAYRHTFELDPGPLSDRAWACGESWVCGQGLACGQQLVRRHTLAVDKQVAVWEHRSCLVQRWTLSVAPQGCMLTVGLLGYDQQLGSSTNTAGSLAALSDQTAGRWVLPTDLTVRLGPYSVSTALSGSNNLSIAGLSLTVEQALEALPSRRTGLYVDAPFRRGPVQVALQLILPRHTATTQVTRMLAETACMATLTCTGTTIPTTSTAYSLALYLPTVRLVRDPLPVGGPGLVAEAVDLVALTPAARPASFPVSLRQGPLYVQVTSGVSAHQLE